MAGDASEETTAESLKTMIDGLVQGLKLSVDGIALKSSRSDIVPHHTSEEMR
jgi:hypothetical protein